MIKLLVCEDQTLVRQGLITILGLEAELEIVGEAANGREAIEKFAALQPEIVLMDVQMPHLDGVSATAEICRKTPAARVIMLTTFDNDDYVFRAVKAGALGYVLKDTPAEELIAVIHRVYAGERFIQPAIASKLIFEFAGVNNMSRYEPLSDRELSVLQRLAQGMSNRAIASDLSLTEGTVKNYVSAILTKLHAANRVQAVNTARQEKII
jgi:two-component system, NarL family, response regulator DegU